MDFDAVIKNIEESQAKLFGLKETVRTTEAIVSNDRRVLENACRPICVNALKEYNQTKKEKWPQILDDSFDL